MNDKLEELRKEVGAWADSPECNAAMAVVLMHNLLALIDQQQVALKLYREALKHYAKREAWQDFVADSYSGQCWEFNWGGELANHPWEIAVTALTETWRICEMKPFEQDSVTTGAIETSDGLCFMLTASTPQLRPGYFWHATAVLGRDKTVKLLNELKAFLKATSG